MLQGHFRSGLGLCALDQQRDGIRLTFDYTSPNARERELPCKFLLTRAADDYNNQDVFLKLRERIGKTSHYQDYVSQRLQLRRSISTDFDF